METMIQNETTFYKDSFVTVTQSRFVTHSKTYAMRNISSVHVFEIIRSKSKALIMTILGFLFLFSKDIFWVGIIIVVLGIWWLFTIKNEYAVRISTNAGEANSIVSKNRDYIQKIVNALNEAIIHRG
jgi:ABC-type siderophore export system fused ATPase/permease subunit